MKKKGLIISTVVMVIVLIASLTTATYAWFSSTSQAVVGDIGMSATAAEGLIIGAAHVANPGQSRTDYANGAVKWNNTLWDGNVGLGTAVTPQMDQTTDSGTESVALAFKLDKALTKKTAEMTVDGVNDGEFVKAAGKAGDDTQSDGNYSKAIVNEDYLDLVLGIAATSDKAVDQITCTLTVTADDVARIAMAAAIHFNITVTAPGVDGAETVIDADLDAFTGLETTTTGFGAGKSVTKGAYDATNGVWTYKFVVATKAAGFEVTSTTLDIAKVRIVAWIDGNDGSCRTENAGTGAMIGIAFDYSTPTTDDVVIENGVVKTNS